jgi:enoyl-CoA hydratase
LVLQGQLNGGEAVVEIEYQADYVVARLGHPPANPLSPELLAALKEALDAVEAAECRTLVFASRVPGFFAAGADIKHMHQLTPAEFARYGAEMRATFDRIAALPIVTIAAIDGLALGGGLELALACTLRIASRRAKLGLPEIKLGLIPGAGGTQRLPRVIGRGRALDLLLTGRQMNADEAYAVGLLERLVEDGRAEQEAVAIATQLAGHSLSALAATLRCVDQASSSSLSDGIAFEAVEENALFEHGEALEGLSAFLMRRPPAFGREAVAEE